MQFVFPGFLWAIALLAVPIIIHLFYFRRAKKVYFTNLKFLKAVQEEQNMRSRLRNLLILLMRMTALAALVLAFAQPFFASKNAISKGRKAVSIFVDNSFSMNARTSEVPLIELAKTAAREIVQGYQPDDRFQILTNELSGRQMRMIDKSAALQLIDEIQIGPNVHPLSQIVQRQKQVLAQDESPIKTTYLISDFQKSVDNLAARTDTLLDIRLVPLQAYTEQNVSIDTCYFEAPVPMKNQINRLIVKVRNWNSQAIEDLRLSINYQNQEKPIGSLSIPAQSIKTDTINFSFDKTGLQEISVKINDYPIQFDDQWNLAFNTPDRFKVLQIHDGIPNSNLKAALSSIKNFEAKDQEANKLNYSSFGDYQMIVLDGLKSPSTGLAAEIEKYLKSGGNLLIFPSITTDLNAYNSFFSILQMGKFEAAVNAPRIVGSINKESFLFRDIFENRASNIKLPTAILQYPMQISSSAGAEILMRFREGDPYLLKYKMDLGQAFICNTPLAESAGDLVKNAEIFVPMLFKMTISRGETTKASYVIGQDESLDTKPTAGNVETYYKLEGNNSFIPTQQKVGNRVVLNLNKQIRKAGFYHLTGQDGKTLESFAFNYDRRESDLSYVANGDLLSGLPENYKIIETADVANLASLIGEQDQGKPFWRICIWIALLCLAIEVLLLRYWKV